MDPWPQPPALVLRNGRRYGIFLLALTLGTSPSPALTPVQAQAQTQSQEQLTMDRRFPEAFGMVGPVRELSDGRVMVADPLGQVLAVMDFESNRADTLGRLGEGPQEYGQPDAVFPLAGDTTLLVDLGNARLTKIGPGGDFLSSTPMGQETTSGGLIVVLPRGVDEKGRLYFRSEVQPMGAYPDSAALLRFDPSTRVLDTLALLKVPELPPPPLPGGGGFRGKAAEPQDDWAVGPDGSVVIIRSGDYSVQWLSPGGEISTGPKHDYEAVRIGDEEKEIWVAEADGSRVGMTSDGTGTVSVFRSGEEGGRHVANMYDWPRVFPAVKPGRTLVSPNGEAWVERYTAAGERPLIDRFDEHGRRVGQLRLPMGRRVAGFGRGRVFLIFTDEYGLQWIERYRWEGGSRTLEACTAFAFHASGSGWVGKNLDWAVEDGIVVVNERGVRKEAWNLGPDSSPGSDFSWVSRFGSVTFNQFGFGFPQGGINEAGLVVEELSYSPTRYPEPDRRPALNELQWIQYQLDSSSSVDEVVASDTLVRIGKFLFGLHYLVADSSGSVAVIEFLDGERVVHTGDNLPVDVLANDTYSNSVRYLGHHVGFGGSRVVTDGPESPERFVRAATLLQEYAAGPTQTANPKRTTPRDFAFQVLESVKQSDTQWSIAYDQGNPAASFTSASHPSIRTIALDTLDFSCRPADLVVPISSGPAGFRRDAEGPWTVEENGELVRGVFRKLAHEFGPDELPAPEMVAELASYPATEACGSVSKKPPGPWTNPVHGFYRGPIKKHIPLRDRIHGPTTAIGIHRQREPPPESDNQE